MSWEKKGKSKYYYQKYRVGDKVFSKYIGNDKAAEATAAIDEQQRKQRRLERMMIKEIFEKEKKYIDMAIDINRQNSNLIKALMLINGFHTHKGQWRKLHG